ncbi:MAG: hypothetical protein ACRDHZ_03915 [Ktedonobacteraceae bacterium]
MRITPHVFAQNVPAHILDPTLLTGKARSKLAQAASATAYWSTVMTKKIDSVGWHADNALTELQSRFGRSRAPILKDGINRFH